MAFNGSGTFNRSNGTNSGSTTWADDRDAGTKITADNHDTHDQDIAAGLSNCVTKDGQTTRTADSPMSGYKHTNVDDAAARNQYASAAQVQDDSLNFVTTTGSSSAYVLTFSPAYTAYTAGMRIVFKANHTSDGSCTVNVNGLGAKNLKDCDGSSYIAECVQNGQVVEAWYDGTDFRTSTLRSTPVTTYTPTFAASGGTWGATAAVAAYRLIGKECTLHIQTSGIGAVSADSNYLTVSTPIQVVDTVAPGFTAQNILGRDNSGYFPMTVIAEDNSTTIRLHRTSAYTSSTAFTTATDGAAYGSFSYWVAV